MSLLPDLEDDLRAARAELARERERADAAADVASEALSLIDKHMAHRWTCATMKPPNDALCDCGYDYAAARAGTLRRRLDGDRGRR